MAALQLAVMVTVTAAAVQKILIDAPVLYLLEKRGDDLLQNLLASIPSQSLPPCLSLFHPHLAEGENTELLHDVKLARLVKMENVGEQTRVPVEVELPLLNVIVVAHLQDGLFRLTGQQAAQARVWKLPQCAGAQAALQPAHVDMHQGVLGVLDPAGEALLHHVGPLLHWNTHRDTLPSLMAPYISLSLSLTHTHTHTYTHKEQNAYSRK